MQLSIAICTYTYLYNVDRHQQRCPVCLYLIKRRGVIRNAPSHGSLGNSSFDISENKESYISENRMRKLLKSHFLGMNPFLSRDYKKISRKKTALLSARAYYTRKAMG